MITRNCVKCGLPQEIHCTPEELARYEEGSMPIQHAMPNTPADERELFISGYCGACWKRLFAPRQRHASLYE